MIHLLSVNKNKFPELKKILFQKCNTCKSEIAIDNLWDIEVQTASWGDDRELQLSVACPHCHGLVILNTINYHRYLKTLKKGNINPYWMEKYKRLVPLEKPIMDTIRSLKFNKSDIKTYQRKKDNTKILSELSENLFDLARYVRTFNFPDVKLSNGEYDPDFERFCVRYDNGTITSSKDAYDYIIETYKLEDYI